MRRKQRVRFRLRQRAKPKYVRKYRVQSEERIDEFIDNEFSNIMFELVPMISVI